MRLWHKDLIPVLPRQQLLAQWRECCCIARNIAVNDTPNHILVNKILEYPESQFNVYTLYVYKEMVKREYKCDWNKFTQWRINRNYEWELSEIFPNWHNDRYFKQCFYNLQEKYDCGGIPKDEWQEVKALYQDHACKFVENFLEKTSF